MYIIYICVYFICILYMYIIRISYMDTVYVYCICIYNIYIYIQCIYINPMISDDLPLTTILWAGTVRHPRWCLRLRIPWNFGQFLEVPWALFCFAWVRVGFQKRGILAWKIYIYIVVIYIYYNRRVAKISTDIDKWWLSYQPSNSGEVYGDFSVKYVGDDSWLCLVIVDGL